MVLVRRSEGCIADDGDGKDISYGDGEESDVSCDVERALCDVREREIVVCITGLKKYFAVETFTKVHELSLMKILEKIKNIRCCTLMGMITRAERRSLTASEQINELSPSSRSARTPRTHAITHALLNNRKSKLNYRMGQKTGNKAAAFQNLLIFLLETFSHRCLSTYG